MRKEYVIVALCLAVIAFMIAGLMPVVAAGPLYVDRNGCGGASPCYSTLQAAVNAAVSGDEIRVRGIQRDPGGARIIALVDAKNLLILGGWDSAWNANPGVFATLDATAGSGDSIGRVFAVVGGAQVTLRNLIFTNGFTPPTSFEHPRLTSFAGDGGGLLVAEAGTKVTVQNCEFSNNTALVSGGGMFLDPGSTAAVTQSRFTGNLAPQGGGGIYVLRSSATINSSTFSGNTAIFAGGIAVSLTSQQTVTMTNNIVTGNLASFGGGVGLLQGRALLLNNVIELNTARDSNNPNQGHGGGVFWYNAFAGSRFEHNRLRFNKSLGSGANGGGVFMSGSDSSFDSNVIVQNSVSGSTGASGMYLSGITFYQDVVRHNTFAHNTGGEAGVIVTQSEVGGGMPVNFQNNIIAGHAVGLKVVGTSQSHTVLTSTKLLAFNTTNVLVQNAVSVSPNYTGNPLLKSDFVHLTAGSPACGPGGLSALSDIDGQAFSQCIGADELNASDQVFPPLAYIYLPLILK